MAERIEKIERVKIVENDVGRRFDTKNHRNDKNRAFLNEYRRFLNRKPAHSGGTSDAYDLELTSDGIPALFYFGDRDIRGLLK